MTAVFARRPVPGFGSLQVGTVDRHPRLVWIAAAGLVTAMLLGTFGMPPIGLHLPTHDLGIMGPLCGMTRAVARAAVGDLAASWRHNPGGLVLVAGAWGAIVRTAIGRRTRRWPNLQLGVTPPGMVGDRLRPDRADGQPAAARRPARLTGPRPRRRPRLLSGRAPRHHRDGGRDMHDIPVVCARRHNGSNLLTDVTVLVARHEQPHADRAP